MGRNRPNVQFQPIQRMRFRRTDGWKDGRTDRQTDRQTAGWKEITYCIVRKAMAEIHRKENDEDKHKNEIDQKEKKMWV